MTRPARFAVLMAVLLIVAGFATACDSDQPPEDGAQPTVEPTAPEATAPPEETSPPTETTAAPDGATDEETAWWVLLIVLGGLFILIIALFAGRRRRKAAPAAPAAWRAHAQRGYAEARWLNDNLTESLAIWHGDAEFEAADHAGATDAARQKTWDQLAPRMERATAELYALEAAAGPGSPALVASQKTVAALNETYAAVTERSDARVAYRSAAESTDEVSPADLTSARDREVRASASLTAAHNQLSAALTDLSPIA